MVNSDSPLRAELPSSKQLLRSTILAAISAVVLLVAVVLLLRLVPELPALVARLEAAL